MAILVVGLGPCGLVAVKECAAAGLEVVGVDMAAEIGGVFRRGGGGGCYEGLHLTTSNVFMSFSDFPTGDPGLKYSRDDDYAAYLARYAARFDLSRRFELRTRVSRAARAGSAWRVETVREGVARERSWAGLVVATGANGTPKVPRAAFVGFSGEISHSADYRASGRFAGSRGLVVGAGESASDIVTEVATVAAAATVWTRRGVVFAPRFPELNITDASHDERRTVERGCEAGLCVNDFLEWATTARVGLFWPVWAYGGARQLIWRVLARAPSAPAQAREMAKQALRATNGVGSKAFWMADQSQWVTKNARMCGEIARGRVRHVVAASVVACARHRISFSSGEHVEADHVICCTGYGPTFDWLDRDDVGCDPSDPRNLYKHAIPPTFDAARVCFVGLARGHQGGIPQMGEMQARYAALLFAGARRLPPKADLERLAATEAKAETDYYYVSPRLRVLVDYPSYMESLARLVGCEPRSITWWTPVLCAKYLFYPLWPCFYRLDGPGADEAAARAVLDAFPLRGSLRLTPFLPLFPVVYAVQRVVNVVAFLVLRGACPGRHWLFATSKHFVLHGNALRAVDLYRP